MEEREKKISLCIAFSISWYVTAIKKHSCDGTKKAFFFPTLPFLVLSLHLYHNPSLSHSLSLSVHHCASILAFIHSLSYIL